MMLKLSDGRSELWQWDTNRKLTVDAECSQVHFSNKVFGRSIDVDVVGSIASVPDILLQTDKELTAWAFVGTPENGYTKISKTFKVNRRNKPADYVFTPPDQTSLEEIKERLDDLESIQDPDAIKNAVDDYLQNNPIQIDEEDPTVPEWAKQPEKPRYTADEVGAIPNTTNIPSKTSDLTNDSGFVNNAVNDLVNYYLKSETYSRDEVKQLISSIPKFSIKPVSQLPTTGISETTIYLVPGGDGDDLYTEYIRVSGKWEILGSQKMDLTGYATEIYVKDYAQPKGNYLTEVPKGYATEQFVKEKIAEAEMGGEEVDLSGYALKSELPTKTSQLENDSGYLNAVPEGYAKKEDIPTSPEDIGAQPAGDYAINSEIRLELEAINRRLTAFFDSDDQTLDELSEIVAYITSNKSLIDSITTSKVSVSDIINNLTTNVTNKPLSATQGVVLKGLVDALDKDKLDTSALADAINEALAYAKASGEFDGADGKDYVLTKEDKTEIAEMAADLVVEDADYVTPEMFGAKGDGTTDDSAAIQECLSYANENSVSVQFNPKTYICYGLNLSAGVHVDGNGATLKKPNLSAEPYNMTVEEMKWARLISVSYSGDADSKMTVIKNLEFDGNCWEMWSVEDGYSQEQASLLYVSCQKDNAGRLFIRIENCYFHDNVSDGIHIVTNTTAIINNCRSLDCFRGGLTVTGGNTTVNVDGFDFRSEQSPDGIDLEQDSNGYGDSRKVNVSLNNIQIDTDLDINVNSDGVVVIDNLVMRKGGYSLRGGGSLTVRNSTLIKDIENYTQAGDLSNLVYAMTTSQYLFENVVFDGSNCNVEGKDSACQLQFYDPSGMCLIFDKCTFKNAQWGMGGTGTSKAAELHVLNNYFRTVNGYGGNTANLSMGLPFVRIEGNVFEVTGIAVQSINSLITAPQIIKMSNNHIKSCETSLRLNRTILIMDETWTDGLAVAYATGYTSNNYYGKRKTFVSADPNGIRGIEGTNFVDVATDGTSYWRYSGSGTVWDVADGLLVEGAEGKSAYEFAQEGGYTGTEEEFAQDINPDNISAGVAKAVREEIPLVKVAEQPTFVNSVDEMTDVGKVYVMPDIVMWANMDKEDYVLTADDFKVTAVNTSGALISGRERIATINLLPLSSKISVNCPTAPYQYFVYYFDSTQTYIGKTSWKRGSIDDVLNDTVTSGTKDGAAYCRVSFRDANDVSGDLTDRMDEFMANVSVTQSFPGEKEWRSTGYSYNQPADYEDRIIALEKALGLVP